MPGSGDPPIMRVEENGLDRHDVQNVVDPFVAMDDATGMPNPGASAGASIDVPGGEVFAGASRDYNPFSALMKDPELMVSEGEYFYFNTDTIRLSIYLCIMYVANVLPAGFFSRIARNVA